MAAIVRFPLIFLFALLFLWRSSPVLAHDVAQHVDPELLTGWRTWLHLTIQWVHLVAFALWLGLTMGTLLLKLKPPFDQLLYGSWALFLIILATGAYNMEWSAGISETPSLFLLPLLEKIPYGVTYSVALAIKSALYVVTVLLTLVITLLHLRRRIAEERLRKIFLISGAALAVLITLAASVVLFYHEVADLWPTPIHSLGGVMGPEGPRTQAPVSPQVSPPNDFGMLANRDAWIDIGLRWLHLLGFGLWLGGSAWVLCFGGVSAARYLLFSWLLLAVQIASGIASMGRWTPFYLSPYMWNLNDLSFIRFGRSYTFLMTIKHILVIFATLLTLIVTTGHLRFREEETIGRSHLRHLLAMNLLLGLIVGYIMIIVLLIHEGVDHAL